MDILVTSDKNFVAHTATTLASVFRNNKNVNAHWITNGLTNSIKRKITNFAQKLSGKVTFYEIDESTFKWMRFDKHVSLATYYRLFAPAILPTSIEKIVD